MVKLFGKSSKLSIDCQEAYNIWDALKSRYDILQLAQIYQNFIHDPDFKYVVANTFMRILNNQVNELEKQMDMYQVLLPERPPKFVRTPANSEAFEDKFIALRFLTVVQDNITQQLRFIRTSLSNDDVRKIMIRFLKEEAELYDASIKYVKLRGWLGIPPMYKQIPEDNSEFLDSGEAFHLCDHLTSRYQTIEKTQLYQNFAHDIDFKGILLVGLQQTLEKQVNMLEKECNSFRLPLVARPPKSVHTTEGKELFNDEAMFRDIFTGMQYMVELHATALRQCTTNDRLRAMYIDLLNKELSDIDVWIKYGKTKAWLRQVPMYIV